MLDALEHAWYDFESDILMMMAASWKVNQTKATCIKLGETKISHSRCRKVYNAMQCNHYR